MTPSRSVTGSSTDEVRRCVFQAHGREADTRTGRGNDLGVSVRTVRRWEDRCYEADGAEGLYDRRLGKLANNRVPTDTAMEMLTLFDSKYWDYSPRHFHEKLVTPARVYPELQLGTPHITEPWPGSVGSAARSPPA